MKETIAEMLTKSTLLCFRCYCQSEVFFLFFTLWEVKSSNWC